MSFMPNIASLLKAEIARVARKEVRLEVEPLRKTLSSYRADIAALKRRAQAAEQELKMLQKAQPKKPSAPSAEEMSSRSTRFSAKGLLSQRKRLGLSAEDCGLLLGASGQSVYNWESGKKRPRAQHLAAIVALKTLGKRSAAAALESLRKT
jgi:DNA-binding transcriptional regulator YiaG